MHFVFSYALSIEAGSRRNDIVDQIEGFLPANNFVRRLSTFYVVHIDTLTEWNTIGNVSLCFLFMLLLFGGILGYKIWQMHRSKKSIRAKQSVDAFNTEE